MKCYFNKNKRFFLVIIIFLALVFFVNFSSAEFTIGNPNSSIEKIYGPSDSIRGWINLSFKNEPANSVFSSSFDNSSGNSVTLIELLKKGNYIYSCVPSDCSQGYNTTNPETQKTFNFGPKQEKIFGLKFVGNIIQINSIGFNLQSDAQPSCTNQLKIDFLNDEQIDFINNKSISDTSCYGIKSYGCYTQNPGEGEYTLSEIPYCQKINLTESPGFFTGAWIKNYTQSNTQATKKIKLFIFKKTGEEAGNCEIKQQISSFGNEVFCEINYTLTKPEEHSVCIQSTSGTGTYKIKGYYLQNGCGYYGFSINSATNAAYSIFAEGKMFDSPDTLQIQNKLPDGNFLGDLAYSYILKKYGSLNCTQGCVVPVKIISGTNQQVTLSGLSLNYQNDIGLTSENNFYDIMEVPAKISSNFQKIYVNNNNFSVPENFGVYSFSLLFKNSLIFKEKINVTNVPRILSLSPLVAPAAYPTEFVLFLGSRSNITKIFWDFGDNSTEITTLNKTRHTYKVIGIYNLTLTVTDTRGLSSSRTFEINVTSPKNIIMPTINATKIIIARIKNQTSNFDEFSKKSIYNELKLENISSRLNSLETSFLQAQTDQEYSDIVTDLLKFNLPENVYVGEKTAEPISFVADKNTININSIASITGERANVNKTEEYKNAVLLWNIENLNVTVGLTKYNADYKEYHRNLLTVINLKIREKKSVNGSYYLIIPKFSNFTTDSVYREKEDFIYFDIKNSGKDISFSTTEELSIADLPIFISPKISSLSIEEKYEPIIKEEEKSKKTIIILTILILLILAFIAYLILRNWYKKRYEDYLFRNKNDLYNLVTYITQAKKKGLKDKEIVEHLKKAKWNSEQIRYVMKKYAGKKTGMPI